MPKSNPERQRKLAEWKASQQREMEAGLPAPVDVLTGLFETLDKQLAGEGCDHSLRFSLAWADSMKLDRKRLVEWTRAHGGYCDCEVLANVQEIHPVFANRG